MWEDVIFSPLVMACRHFMRKWLVCDMGVPCSGIGSIVSRSDKYFTDTQAYFYLRLIQVFVNTA